MCIFRTYIHPNAVFTYHIYLDSEHSVVTICYISKKSVVVWHLLTKRAAYFKFRCEFSMKCEQIIHLSQTKRMLKKLFNLLYETMKKCHQILIFIHETWHFYFFHHLFTTQFVWDVIYLRLATGVFVIHGSVICPFYCMWHNNIQFTWANIHFRWIITFRAIIHCSWSVFCEWQSLIKVFFSSKNSNNSKNEMRLSFECSVLRVTMALLEHTIDDCSLAWIHNSISMRLSEVFVFEMKPSLFFF